MKKRLIPILGLVLVMLFCAIGLVACQKEKASEGLEYLLINEKEYEVVGIGDCEDANIIIPSKYKGKAVTSIGRFAFFNCSSLKSIIIPNSVASIGDSALSGCSSLEEITLPFVGAKAGVTSSDTYQYPFRYIFGTIPTSLKKVTITGGNILGDSAFSDCNSLTSIEIPDSVTSIGKYAFYDCRSLTSIEIPDSVTSISDYAFSYCESLTSVVIGDSVTSIGNSTFSGCDSLTSIAIPNSVTSIGNNAFSYCESLTRVKTPDSITSIGDMAFYDCNSLTSIAIPNSVTSIGNNAFSNCESLTSITFNGTKTEWNRIEKGSYWKYNTKAAYVACTDGTVYI